MKRIIALIFTAGALFGAAFGQTSTTTRPRVASTPKPPVIKNDPYSTEQSNTSSRPPTLIGGSNRPQPSATATPAIDDENEVIKVETELVTMPVSVLDRDGRFVSGLQQRDFQIFENGTEQKVEWRQQTFPAN